MFQDFSPGIDKGIRNGAAKSVKFDTQANKSHDKCKAAEIDSMRGLLCSLKPVAAGRSGQFLCS